ncbi:hypothetical protein [Rhizobium sp. SYY.PMSO]|uniref:hypothetical protein n=1 Tax=Rhizobium sp. SYY.PMSO TaxID=3382192 RepID=UPI00398FB7EB
MPNKPVPAAAEGVPSLIDVVDQLGHTRGMLDVINFALDSMASEPDGEINALQEGVSEARARLTHACAMLDAHREAAR